MLSVSAPDRWLPIARSIEPKPATGVGDGKDKKKCFPTSLAAKEIKADLEA